MNSYERVQGVIVRGQPQELKFRIRPVRRSIQKCEPWFLRDCLPKCLVPRPVGFEHRIFELGVKQVERLLDRSWAFPVALQRVSDILLLLTEWQTKGG